VVSGRGGGEKKKVMMMDKCVIYVHISTDGKYVHNNIIQKHKPEHRVALKTTSTVKHPVSKTQNLSSKRPV
jgi:hypothetical protein